VEEESSKFGLHISWAKTKVQNTGAGPDAQDLVVNGHTSVSEVIYISSKQFLIYLSTYLSQSAR